MNENAVTIYGNLGADPTIRVIPAKPKLRKIYDIETDQVLDREIPTQERELHTFSIAVSKKSEDGEDITRWIQCVDWKNLSRELLKGDRVKVRGYFKERTYTKIEQPKPGDDETEPTEVEKTVREFIVETLHLERSKAAVAEA